MQDLIDKLEKATADEQESVLRDALAFAWQRGWLSRDTYNRAREWVDLGAYESAALTLVPEGWSRLQKTAEHHENGFVVELWRSWGPDAYKRISVRHQTEAIALCIAALKARGGQSA